MKTIETERLIIRPMKEKDAPKLLELLSKPRVNCFVSEKIETLEEALEHINSSNPDYDFAVCTKDDELAGILFGGLEDEPGDTFSPCWNFLGSASGKGYCTEAARAYFDYLFNEKNIRRLYAYTEIDNLPSQNVCKKLGMRHEGTFKDFISFVNNPDGTPKYETTMQFAILKSEWNRE